MKKNEKIGRFQKSYKNKMPQKKEESIDAYSIGMFKQN